MSGQVAVRKAASDLTQITVPNISHCSSVLSTRFLSRKVKRYGPGEIKMVAICGREVSKDLDAAQQRQCITKLGKVIRPIVRQYERLCAAQVDPRLH